MKTREQIELENMALVAEVSRQLVHDFNNFVYNFRLMIEISERQKSARVDWGPMKQESVNMTRLLREWERFHNRCSIDDSSQADLHQLIQQAVTDSPPGNRPVKLAPSISAGPLWLSGCSLTIKHLLVLLLEDAVQPGQESRTNGTLSVETARADEKLIVRIRTHDDSSKPRLDSEPQVKDGPPSLLMATCISIARRLDATIECEHSASGQSVTSVEFSR